MQCPNKHSNSENKQHRKHENVACYKCGVKGHMPYKCCFVKHDFHCLKGFWFQNVLMFYLTTKDP